MSCSAAPIPGERSWDRGAGADPDTQAYPEPLSRGEVPGLAAFTALKEGVLQGLLCCQAPHRVHLQQPRDLGETRALGAALGPPSLSPWPLLTRSLTVLERSSHSGELNWYWPSMIMRNIRIWRRCQNGGEPARSVNRITPQAQLGKNHSQEGLGTRQTC